jgi:hypothetical protein
MKRNVGKIDRIIRAVVGIALIVVGAVLGGWVLILGLVLGVIFLITAAIGFCPLYVPFKISTIKK